MAGGATRELAPILVVQAILSVGLPLLLMRVFNGDMWPGLLGGFALGLGLGVLMALRAIDRARKRMLTELLKAAMRWR